MKWLIPGAKEASVSKEERGSQLERLVVYMLVHEVHLYGQGSFSV